MTLEWQEVLFCVWKENHVRFCWPEVYESHDEEDRSYFMELEEEDGLETDTRMDATGSQEMENGVGK